jgi:hypothetical protein
MNAESLAMVAGHAPVLSAPVEKCPYCPASVMVNASDRLAASSLQDVFSVLVAHPAGVVQTESKLRVSLGRSRQKRGPPAISL